MMKKRKVLDLEVGKLEFEVCGNSYADISFEPDPKLCEQLAAKFCKGSGNASKTNSPPSTYQKTKPAKQQISGSYGHSFSEISARARENIMNGNFSSYSFDLFELASIVREEGKRIDELKLRMMKFYIDLSGLNGYPHVDESNVELAKAAKGIAKMSEADVDELFIDTVRESMTPVHAFSVDGSNRLFRLAMDGLLDETKEIVGIVSNYIKNN